SILNCTVVGRDGYTPYFHIVTHAADPERTLFRTNEGRNVAVVGWGGEGSTSYQIFSFRQVHMWIDFDVFHSCRLMYAFGNTYVWAPQGDFVCMYDWVPSAVGDFPDLLARIEKQGRTVTLEIMSEAVNRGLLEMAVVASFVFQSGGRIN
ncbi:hypothetical protein B0H13DRAFT_1669785, partial [Mycena leptocephala]